MSNRTLVEINHDVAGNLVGLGEALDRYVKGADREAAEELERYGIKVLGMRHHSGNFYVEQMPEGFPIKIFSGGGE